MRVEPCLARIAEDLIGRKLPRCSTCPELRSGRPSRRKSNERDRRMRKPHNLRGSSSSRVTLVPRRFASQDPLEKPRQGREPRERQHRPCKLLGPPCIAISLVHQKDTKECSRPGFTKRGRKCWRFLSGPLLDFESLFQIPLPRTKVCRRRARRFLVQSGSSLRRSQHAYPSIESPDLQHLQETGAA